VRPEGLGILKRLNDLTGNRARDLPSCSIVPQPASSIGGSMSNVRGAVGGTRMDREVEALFHGRFVHSKSHMT
jgi:hypothetical protein